MAYGDNTLDEIMAQMRGSEGAPRRPQGRITQTSNFGLPPPEVAPVAPAAPAAAPKPAGFGYKLGRGVAGLARGMFGKAAGALAAGGLLAEGLMGDATVPNAIRTGVGAGAILNPTTGLPLAGGMVAGDAIVGLAEGPVLRAAERAGDVRGPATMEFLARGGMKPPSAVAAPGDTGRDDTLIDSTAGVIPPPAPIAGPDNMLVPPRGTGFIRNNVTGAVTQIDSRGSAPTAPAARPARYDPTGIGALLELKQISGDNALRVARAKQASADLAARGTAARGAAALQTSQASAQLAAEHLKANPGDLAGAAAILHGRSGGQGGKVFFPGLGPNDPVIVGDKRDGTVVKRTPQLEAKMGKDAKGNWQIIGPDGKALRPATAAEIAQKTSGKATTTPGQLAPGEQVAFQGKGISPEAWVVDASGRQLRKATPEEVAANRR